MLRIVRFYPSPSLPSGWKGDAQGLAFCALMLWVKRSFNFFFDDNNLPGAGKSKVASHTPLFQERGLGFCAF
jgi:hypothetical protein